MSHIFQWHTKNSFSDSSDEANGGDAFEFVKKHSVESGFDEKAEVILKSALEERHGDSSSEDDDSGKTIFFFICLYLCNLSIYQRIFFINHFQVFLWIWNFSTPSKFLNPTNRSQKSAKMLYSKPILT